MVVVSLLSSKTAAKDREQSSAQQDSATGVTVTDTHNSHTESQSILCGGSGDHPTDRSVRSSSCSCSCSVPVWVAKSSSSSSSNRRSATKDRAGRCGCCCSNSRTSISFNIEGRCRFGVCVYVCIAWQTLSLELTDGPILRRRLIRERL